MKKLLFAAVLLVGYTVLQVQARPVLGVLPFTGGAGGDGEAIATLISMEPEILGAFTVVPRTAALNAIFEEHYFQLAGLTDSDTIAGIGRLLNADYVLSGNIRRLGNMNLIIATIINVETFEQVAGYHRTYRAIEEVVDFLPSMSRNMVATTLGRGAVRPPSLAMLPFTLAPGIDAQDAETLSKILAIEIINTGSYIVLPRTSTIQAALAEMDFQTLGLTDDEGMAALGRAINADLVLSAGVHRLGALSMFTAQILRVTDGSVVTGARRNYQVIADGINLMGEIAVILATAGHVEVVVQPAPLRPAPAPPVRRPRQRAQPRENQARFHSLGLALGTSFATPVTILTFQGTFAPRCNQFIRLGWDLGFGSSMHLVDTYFSHYLFAHYAVFRPLATGRAGWYIGAGGGIMLETYDFGDGSRVPRNIPAMDFTTGFIIGNMFEISYTLRTNFSSANSKVSAGFNIRF